MFFLSAFIYILKGKIVLMKSHLYLPRQQGKKNPLFMRTVWIYWPLISLWRGLKPQPPPCSGLYYTWWLILMYKVSKKKKKKSVFQKSLNNKKKYIQFQDAWLPNMFFSVKHIQVSLFRFAFHLSPHHSSIFIKGNVSCLVYIFFFYHDQN